jgi:F-type H+-transporting ATPase subunit b
MSLIPSIPTVVFESLNFLVLAGLLYFFLFKPMMANIEARAEEKREMLAQIKEQREEVADLRARWEERISSAEDEAASIVSEARGKAEAERETILKEAEEEVEQILGEAHQDAKRLREQAVEEFHSKVLDAILDVSALVINQLAPEEMHTSMVKDLVGRIWEMGRSEMERVEAFRRSLGDRAPTAHVTSARSLSPELRGELARTLAALADRNVDLDIAVKPELAVGVQVRLGDIVVENTIASQMDDLKDDVKDALAERLSYE